MKKIKHIKKTEEEIIELEKSLYNKNQRYNKEFLNRILHDDFIEESGLTTISKTEILNQLKFNDTVFNFMSEIKVIRKNEIVTLTYVIEKIKSNNTYLSSRKSVWVVKEDSCLLFRHYINEYDLAD